MPEDSEVRILQASSQEIDTVQSLWREYWDSLRMPADFQNFAEEIKTLPGVYAPPPGRLLIARIQGEPAGTAALRSLGAYSCEAKRLYVRPHYRGKGIGVALLERLIEEARAAGYREMFADTLAFMTPALRMYRQFGFSEVAPYSANPTPGGIFLRLPLER